MSECKPLDDAGIIALLYEMKGFILIDCLLIRMVLVEWRTVSGHLQDPCLGSWGHRSSFIQQRDLRPLESKEVGLLVTSSQANGNSCGVSVLESQHWKKNNNLCCTLPHDSTVQFSVE
jgi:hypothetical protein